MTGEQESDVTSTGDTKALFAWPNRSMVRRASDSATYVIAGRAPIRADLGSRTQASSSQIVVLSESEFAQLSELPDDGTVLIEVGSSQTWIMRAGRRILVPSAEALEALAGPDAQPYRVAPAALDHIPARVLPSATSTPPSMIFSPAKARFWAPPIAKFWPREEMPGTTLPNGVRAVTIRGWMTSIFSPADCSTTDPDVHLGIEPDPAWFDEWAFDWTTVFTVGDLFGTPNPIVSTSNTWVCRSPKYKIELNGWLDAGPDSSNWPGAYTGARPADWTTRLTLSDGTNNFDGALFPFDPSRSTDPSNSLLQVGHFVEVSGSLVTDAPHKTDQSYDQILAWDRGYGNADLEVAQNAPGRHTEIHPPDSITLLGPPSSDRAEYVYGVALVAPISVLDPLTSPVDLTVDLIPPGARRNLHYRAKAVEYVGPESNLATVTHGNADRTGASIVESDTHVTISVGVAGGNFAVPTGKFKALYRVWWFDDPASYQLRCSISVDSETLAFHTPVTFTVTAVDSLTGDPVSCNLVIDGTVQGQAGAPVTVTLTPARQRVWVPPVRRQPGGPPATPGYWEVVEMPVVLTVHAVDSPPYAEVNLALGKRVVVEVDDPSDN